MLCKSIVRPRPCAALLALSLGFGALGDVNLEWRSQPLAFCTDQILEVGLYAVSDNAGTQSMASIDVIVQWNPARMQLMGLTDNGPYDWLYSGFPNDAGLDGLNTTFSDGDALYEALARLGNGAHATPAGLLVTTLHFRVLTGGGVTKLEMIPMRGLFTRTVVYGGGVPGQDITGTLDSEFITAVSRGDANCDGLVDFFDIDPFLMSLFDTPTYQATFCGGSLCAVDTNCDAILNFFDIDPFLACLFGGCPPCP
jgi:hypothetical protein